MSDERGRLRKVGAMWKPRPGAKSLGSGEITVNGLKQRFVILKNDRKKNDRSPDYVLMSSDDPEVDEFADRSSRPAAAEPERQEPAEPDEAPF